MHFLVVIKLSMLQLTKRFEKLEQVSETFCIYFNAISISFLHICVIFPILANI